MTQGLAHVFRYDSSAPAQNNELNDIPKNTNNMLAEETILATAAAHAAKQPLLSSRTGQR